MENHSIVSRRSVDIGGWYATRLLCACGVEFGGACYEVAFDRITEHITGKPSRTADARIEADGIALRRRLS